RKTIETIARQLDECGLSTVSAGEEQRRLVALSKEVQGGLDLAFEAFDQLVGAIGALRGDAGRLIQGIGGAEQAVEKFEAGTRALQANTVELSNASAELERSGARNSEGAAAVEERGRA